MNYTKIETPEQYEQYLQRFAEIFQAEVGTEKDKEANVLSKLIEEWENNIYEIDDIHIQTIDNCPRTRSRFKLLFSYTIAHLNEIQKRMVTELVNSRRNSNEITKEEVEMAESAWKATVWSRIIEEKISLIQGKLDKIELKDKEQNAKN